MEAKEPLGPPELPDTHAAMRPAEPTSDELLGDEPDALNEHWEEPGDPDGLLAAEEQRRWQEHQLKNAPESPPLTRRKRRWPVVVLVLFLIAGAAAGVFWLGDHQATKSASTPSRASTSSAHESTKTAVTPTKHYDSTIYTLGFDYPETWALSDTAARLTITSPALSLTSTGNRATQAHVVVTIQNQQAAITGFPANGVVAALESDKLTYKQPTAVQRAQTYLSYLSYTSASGLDSLYITGDNGYQQGQQVPMSDIAKGNPLISVSFATCTTSDCTSGTPTSIPVLASSWKSTAVQAQVISLLESITLN